MTYKTLRYAGYNNNESREGTGSLKVRLIW